MIRHPGRPPRRCAGSASAPAAPPAGCIGWRPRRCCRRPRRSPTRRPRPPGRCAAWKGRRELARAGGGRGRPGGARHPRGGGRDRRGPDARRVRGAARRRRPRRPARDRRGVRRPPRGAARRGRLLRRARRDLDDIRNRAVAAVLGLPMPGIPAPGHPFILVAEDLAPADTVNLDPDTVLALVTEKGGPTSHTAILARALGLPAVVACPGRPASPTARGRAVDGETGGSSPASARRGRGRDPAAGPRRARAPRPDERAGQDRRRAPGASCCSTSARRPTLRPGVDAEGVGLFRTEFLYLDRTHAARRYEEQVAAYAAVLRAPGRPPVVFRTLDAGTDKPLPFLGLPEEANPALGIRGLRVARRPARGARRPARRDRRGRPRDRGRRRG